MAISLLAYVAIFSDSFIFEKATSSQFFRVTFFQINTRVTFSEQLFFQSSCFFEESFFEHSLFLCIFFFFLRIANFSERDFNHILRIGNSFRTATYRRYLQKSYFFFGVGSSKQHQLFQKNKILEEATFSEQQYSTLTPFSEELPF